MNPTARIMLVDDQTLFRSGLARLLEDDPRIEVVGQASDGREAVELVGKVNPDVVLMDVRMPQMDGIEATRQIIALKPAVKVLMLTTFDADASFILALRAGASGYVLKDSTAEAITSSIFAVLAGEQVMATAVANNILEMLTGAGAPRTYYDGLTAREIEILKMLASGKGNKQIAFQLTISDKTVRNHVSNMYEKLGIYDRSQAVLYAVRKGLVDL